LIFKHYWLDTEVSCCCKYHQFNLIQAQIKNFNFKKNIKNHQNSLCVKVENVRMKLLLFILNISKKLIKMLMLIFLMI